ncbi:Histidine kinase/HSP90-like ATPase superfamily [Sesbania bispinosa]|nr:Histidine kinase/HSP90-like ATPase superfamily [Sesbania bispinosa]
MATPKEHVEQIRRTKFSIGGEPNPLTEDLHQAVKNLSAELYAKDVHFLMELIQNAEDNQYIDGVRPSLEFIITSEDITATGAPATLLIFNNEKGFSPKNIESICSVGRSTKKGNRSSGYIGEKGIGFKSVFLVTAQPYIFSNGYQIRFNERPCPHCNLGYIVPEWVEEKPTLIDIKRIYGAGKDSLPTTTIVLPLKPDKVKPVKQQLSSIHPEVLLFLAKIRQLSVREDNEDPKLNTVSAVSISSEINFVTRKNMNAESYTLHLSAEENDDAEKECSYYMWKQKFPVRLENVVERRTDMEEWVITLAFPNHERLHRGMSLPGVYAFLPTEMVTNFPFIIQADFVLASSRETILLDDKWNQGILECVPSAFMDAFKTLVVGSDQAPVSSLPRMFKFLPIDSSPFEKLNFVREKIKEKLLVENIVPIETYTKQKHFYKPCEVGRLLPSFWSILTKARAEGVYLLDLSSHDGRKILSSSFDRGEYDSILKFLGVKQVNVDWYAKCIQSSDLVDGVSEDVYLELLLFVAKNWSRFKGSNMVNIPLIKYVDSDGSLSHFSLQQCEGARRVVLADSSQSCPCSWLIDWNKEFACAANRFFMPEITQKAILRLTQKQTLLEWLENQVNITTLNISMPLVDNYGCVTECRKGVLVPANVSKWADLIGSNPWRNENYVELGKEYLRSSYYADQCTGSGKLIEFLKTHVEAADIPYISPPNAGFSAVDTPLTKDNAFLLLDWIRNLRQRGVRLPEKFLKCIKEGSWLRVTVNGCRPPCKSFLIRSSLGRILQNGSVLVDIPLIDESFYGDRINEYEEELKTVGVMFSYEEACAFIGRELMSRAASFTLNRRHVLLMLNFIQYLRKSLLPLDKFVKSIKEGSWLKTSHGLRSPVGSVLNDSGWRVASQVSDIPFIDQAYFGEEIYNFKEELKLLGVIVGFSGNYQVVIDHLKSPSNLAFLTAEAVLLIMECIRVMQAPSKLLNSISKTSCLKTNLGFKTPGECFLSDPVWGCILEVFNGLPIIDHEFYGENIFTYKDELKQTGVVVDYEVAFQKFARLFKEKASQNSFNPQHIKSFLSCCRLLKESKSRFPSDFSIIIRTKAWLHTRLGSYSCPGQCILYGPEWKAISLITRLPFIDDSDKCYGMGIHEYKKELKRLGVIIELKDGKEFVPKCLSFPSDPSTIAPESVFCFLECIRLLMPVPDQKLSIDDEFSKRLSRNWLKTHAGYRPPDKCLLFDSNWSSYLKPTDGPFIDENLYGPKIASYKKELNAVGVTVDVEKGCFLVANHLDFLSDSNSIVQVYRYLSRHDWKPEDKVAMKIWIPNAVKGGKWVNSEECVIHNQDNLFGSKFYVLEDIYDKKLLPFFSFAMNVRNKPSLDDYVDLWNDWESSVEQLSYDKCCKFWMFILKHLSTNMEKKLSDSVMKLPVTSGDNEIFLLDKEDVFIPDNLHLKKLFEQEKIFVWCPQQNLSPLSRCKLFDIYKKIGARNISEYLCKEESSILNGVELKQVYPNDIFNLKGLVKLILGFLACSSLKMEPEKRHEAVQGLLNLSFFEAVEPVTTVSYSLSLSSGDTITKKANRMVRWERQSSKFFTQKMKGLAGNALKYATYFSEAISEGVLRENHDHVPALTELIKLAFVLKFKNEEIEFLMESNNLQIFCKDEEFLSSAFPSD